jgi:hypothetical protein
MICTGYAYLTYREATSLPARTEGFLQPQQLDTKKWDQAKIMSFKPHPYLLYPTLPEAAPYLGVYLAPATPVTSFRLPNRALDGRYLIQSNQPLIEANGILRWAFDNIAHATAPPCKAVLDEVYDDSNWASKNALGLNEAFNQSLYFTPMGGDASTWQGSGKVQVGFVEAGTMRLVRHGLRLLVASLVYFANCMQICTGTSACNTSTVSSICYGASPRRQLEHHQVFIACLGPLCLLIVRALL